MSKKNTSKRFEQDEMRRLLTGMGIAHSEIAYIHDAETDKSRQKLFDRMRK